MNIVDLFSAKAREIAELALDALAPFTVHRITHSSMFEPCSEYIPAGRGD